MIRRGVLLVCCMTLPAWSAEPQSEDSYQDALTVEAAAPSSDDVAAFATVLDASELIGKGEDLSDVLRRSPGTRVFSYGGVGRYATVSQRGSTAEQVAVMVDGVLQNAALGGAVDLSLVPLAELQTVTVYRGFAPASTGAFGLGGLIDIRTRAAQRKPQLQAALTGGALGFVQAALNGSGPLGASSAWRGSVERLQSDGDFRYLDLNLTPLDPRDDRTARRRNNRVETTAASGQLRWEPRDDDTLALSVGWRQRDSGLPGVAGAPAQRAQLREQRVDLSLSWTRRFEVPRGVQAVDILSDLSQSSNQLLDRDGELGLAVQDETTRATIGGIASVLRARWGAHRVTARADLREEHAAVRNAALEQSDRGGLSRRRGSLTIEDALTWRRLTVAPALRWESRRDDFRAGDDGTIPPPARDDRDTTLTGKLALSLQLARGWEWRGSAGRFVRTPNLEELFGDRGAVVGNPRLRPERGVTVEMGVSHRGAPTARGWRSSGEAVLYATSADELILLLPNSQGTAISRNVGAASLRGIELSLALEAPHRISLRASGTLQQTRSQAGFTHGYPLPSMPQREASISASWRSTLWSIGWEWTYVGSNSSDRLDTQALRLPARVLHDVSLSRALPHRCRLSLELQNLFDRETYDVARFPLPGRLAYLALHWEGAWAAR
ncbi:MAG: TonB-dependent receptor [Acidobacteriota bacterium]